MYLELRHFRTLRAIQEAGGLAKAAEILNTTQSALSHQVAGLEDQVGMELSCAVPNRCACQPPARGCCG